MTPLGWIVTGYALIGLFCGLMVYVGVLRDSPVPRWCFSRYRALLAVIATIGWPGVIVVDCDAIWTGIRYTFTSWDPLEEAWQALKAMPAHPNCRCALAPGSVTLTGTVTGTGPRGYRSSEPKTVKGSDVLVSHRVFRLFEDEDGPALGSTIAPYLYEGPVARTSREELDDGRGFFAAKEGHDFYDEDKPAHVVEGEVELFGRVIEGEKGFRAEKLRIRSLTLRPGGWHSALVEPGDLLSLSRRPIGADRQFCSCMDAERPWPHPYTEIVEALEERYRCEVSYEPRAERNLFEQRHGEWSLRRVTVGGGGGGYIASPSFQKAILDEIAKQHETRFTASGGDSDFILPPSEGGMIETPTPQEIQAYAKPTSIQICGGNHGHRRGTEGPRDRALGA